MKFPYIKLIDKEVYQKVGQFLNHYSVQKQVPRQRSTLLFEYTTKLTTSLGFNKKK